MFVGTQDVTYVYGFKARLSMMSLNACVVERPNIVKLIRILHSVVLRLHII